MPRVKHVSGKILFCSPNGSREHVYSTFGCMQALYLAPTWKLETDYRLQSD